MKKMSMEKAIALHEPSVLQRLESYTAHLAMRLLEFPKRKLDKEIKEMLPYMLKAMLQTMKRQRIFDFSDNPDGYFNLPAIIGNQVMKDAHYPEGTRIRVFIQMAEIIAHHLPDAYEIFKIMGYEVTVKGHPKYPSYIEISHLTEEK